jgi:hypothetical protein
VKKHRSSTRATPLLLAVTLLTERRTGLLAGPDSPAVSNKVPRYLMSSGALLCSLDEWTRREENGAFHPGVVASAAWRAASATVGSWAWNFRGSFLPVPQSSQVPLGTPDKNGHRSTVARTVLSIVVSAAWVRFELTERFPVRRFSRPLHSTTLPPRLRSKTL